MKRLIAGCGFLALAAAMPAAAADLPPAMPYKSPAYVTGYNWTGFYVGINGGGAWANSDWDGFPLSNDPTGGMIGITGGYNWQAPGTAWVFGIEGDVDWAFINGNTACPAGIACETRNNVFGTVRARVGFAFDRVMPYVTGGLAFGDIEANRTFFTGASDASVGWTVGAGVEAAIIGNWTAKGEYLYTDLGSIACSAAACGFTTNVDYRASIVRGGINYRF